MTTQTPGLDSQKALSEAFQRIFSDAKRSNWVNIFYVLLTVAVYFGVRRVYNLISIGAPMAPVVATTIQLGLGIFILVLMLHSLMRLQVYKQVYRAFVKLEPLVPEPLKAWFYSQLYRMAHSGEGTSEGFQSFWSPESEATLMLLAASLIFLFVSIFAVTLALSYHWYQEMDVFSLILALACLGLALLPRVYVSDQSPEYKLYDYVDDYFAGKVESIEASKPLALETRVPLWLRGVDVSITALAALLLLVSMGVNYLVHTDSQETIIDTAFVNALVSNGPMGSLSQAQAARQVAMRPLIWNADGVSVVPNPQLASSSSDKTQCQAFEVGAQKKYFFVCADALTLLQLRLIGKWAEAATPQAALALQTVPQKVRGFSASANAN